jgi:hypothetical protein
MAVTALGCLTAVAADAHQFGRGNDRGGPRYTLRDEVDHTFRDSKDLRHYFEHNFSANGHEPRWDRSDRYAHPEHEGRFGQMTLKDAIQNMDEDIERLRAEFAHRGASPAARDLAIEIRDHSNQVDARIGRVGDWYSFKNDRTWRWDRSALFNRWRDLRADIDTMTRDLENRRY